MCVVCVFIKDASYIDLMFLYRNHTFEILRQIFTMRSYTYTLHYNDIILLLCSYDEIRCKCYYSYYYYYYYTACLKTRIVIPSVQLFRYN